MKDKTEKQKTPVKTKGLRKWPWRINKTNQPTPEAKKLWRERKREWQRLMDELVMKSWLTMVEFKEKYMIEIKDKDWNKKRQPKETLTLAERQAVIHIYYTATTQAWSQNRLDRHVPMAPKELDISWMDIITQTTINTTVINQLLSDE